MKPPLVSIVLSVYNGGDKLRSTLSSLVTQTFHDFELIIVNDGSTDCSQSIIDEFVSKDDRIRVISHSNMGLTRSLVIGIRSARGRYIARQDSGDISHPTRLEQQVEYLKAHPETKMIGTPYNIVANGAVIDTVDYPSCNDEILKAIRLYNCFLHGTMMFERSAYLEIGEYREEYKCSQDYELCIRFTKKYNTANLSEVLYDYDVDINSITFTKLDDQAYFAQLARCLHFFDDIGSDGIVNALVNYKYNISLGYLHWIGVVSKYDTAAASVLMRQFIGDNYSTIVSYLLLTTLDIKGLMYLHNKLRTYYVGKLNAR